MKTEIQERNADIWKNIKGGAGAVAVFWRKGFISSIYSDIEAFLCSFFEFMHDI